MEARAFSETAKVFMRDMSPSRESGKFR
jgi:hypothetical protein